MAWRWGEGQSETLSQVIRGSASFGEYMEESTLRFFKTMIIVLALAFTLTIQAFGHQRQDSKAFWETGNAFLNRCDENNADFAQLSAKDKQTWTLMCSLSIQGIRQGIEMTQQIRQETAPASRAAQKYDKEYEEFLKKQYGIDPDFSFPSGNMCIPDEVTVNQLRLVVVQWMKTNPTMLAQHAAWLTYAALTNTYVCPVKKGR